MNLPHFSVSTLRIFLILELPESFTDYLSLILYQYIVSTDEDPDLRIESFAIINLGRVFTKQN